MRRRVPNTYQTLLLLAPLFLCRKIMLSSKLAKKKEILHRKMATTTALLPLISLEGEKKAKIK